MGLTAALSLLGPQHSASFPLLWIMASCASIFLGRSPVPAPASFCWSSPAALHLLAPTCLTALTRSKQSREAVKHRGEAERRALRLSLIPQGLMGLRLLLATHFPTFCLGWPPSKCPCSLMTLPCPRDRTLQLREQPSQIKVT